MDSIKTGANAAIADYTFDDAGRLTKKVLPNGLETVYEYNDANWVTKITLRQAATPTNVLQSFQYGYDNVGNRVWVKYKTGSGDVYNYDETYQLVGVKYGVSNPEDGYDLAVATTREVTYGYDALGNRLRVTDEASMTDYYANNLNQYTQVGANTDFTYDANGNLTGDGTWTYGYDREGHLISASKSGTTVTYQYDALGRRILKNVNGTITNFVYSGQDLIEERDATNAVTAKYVYAGGIDNPVKVIKGSNTYFYQQDALGNVTSLTDGTGAIVESYTYDTFGEPKIKDGSGTIISTPTQPFLFTGREFDVETGLYHYRTRAYSPDLGRFIQPDSIGFWGRDLNLYRYVANDPANRIDPEGLQSPTVSMPPIPSALDLTPPPTPAPLPTPPPGPLPPPLNLRPSEYEVTCRYSCSLGDQNETTCFYNCQRISGPPNICGARPYQSSLGECEGECDGHLFVEEDVAVPN